MLAALEYMLLASTGLATGLAAYALAPKLAATHRSSERWLVTLLIAHVVPLGAWWLISWFGGFTQGFASASVLALAGAILVVTHRRTLRSRLWRDARRLASIWRPSPETLPAYSVAVAALFAVLTSLAHIVYYPSWSWDCVWYHGAQARFVVQHASVHYWVESNNAYVNSYPRLVETFAAFTMVVLKSSALDDAPQVFWALTGVVSVIAWCRRLGTPPNVSFSLGLGWLLLPAVFLQMHTTHADIAAGALFLALTYFASSTPTARALAMSLVCGSLLIAAKMSGVILVGLMAPWVIRLAFKRGRLLLRQPVLATVVLVAVVLGLSSPVRNFVHTGNPVYPARVELFGRTMFEGPVNEDAIAGSLSFLRTPGALSQLVEAWYREPGEPYPDIRERPFGRTVNYLVFPFAVLGLGCLVARRRKLVAAQLLYAVVVSLMVPAPWWGRFVLGVPGMALVASSAWLTWLGRFNLMTRSVALCCLGALATFQVWDVGAHFIGYRNTPVLGGQGARSNLASLRADKRWMWGDALVAARESDLREGDLVVHDQSVQFLSELWNWAATSRLAFINSDDARHFCDEVEASRAKWVAVTQKSEAETELLRRHPQASRVGEVPMSSAAIYRLSNEGQAAAGRAQLRQ